jgi:hypothetical protein
MQLNRGAFPKSIAIVNDVSNYQNDFKGLIKTCIIFGIVVQAKC